MVRAIRSGDPPGGSGTTKRTGRFGKSCAIAGAIAAAITTRQKARRMPYFPAVASARSAADSHHPPSTIHESRTRSVLKSDIDVLRLRERDQLVVALLAADARLLVAAERDADPVRAGAVHPDEARLDARAGAMRVCQARRPHRAGEPVLDRVDLLE